MQPRTPRRTAGASGKSTLTMIAFALACVAVPGLFFYQTWYGVRLSDDQLQAYMEADASPRQKRHAVEEITERLRAGQGGDGLIADLIVLSREEDPAVRFAAAWAMQEDPGHPAIQARLLELLEDPSAIVRRNAATSLARGGSVAGRAVLHAMLAPFTVVSPESGTVESVLGEGETARAGRPVARLDIGDDEAAEIRAAVPGRVLRALVAIGDTVEVGQELVVIAADDAHAFNAAGALALVGTEEDRGVLVRATGPQSGFSEDVRRQAQAALRAIDDRGK